jgi:hypothetical protein
MYQINLQYSNEDSWYELIIGHMRRRLYIEGSNCKGMLSFIGVFDASLQVTPPLQLHMVKISRGQRNPKVFLEYSMIYV